MWADRYHEFEVGAIGTGIAIADYDGDGRPDIFVVHKTESCRLFRNLGNWRFEDVTEKAGVADVGENARIWKQGVAFADVNNDGRVDIYVCRFGAPNLLYINQGDGKFREEAKARGLDVVDASVMASFCDYDRDGFLDVYIVTNMLDAALHPNGQESYLFHNNGDGTFKNVTKAAGIGGEGQSHSATWWDFDNDGWPDLYVANDFAMPDKLYKNNRDGTFQDVLEKVVPHTPFSSMGSDIGDINNDGLPDFLVADMATHNAEKDQRGMAVMRGQSREPAVGAKTIQVLRNALYINSGAGRVLEAASLAGLDATDWTWSVRFEDLDNDGRLDLFVTNGMHREAHNADLIDRIMRAERPEEKIQIEKSTLPLEEKNLAYKNLGDLRFSEVGKAWGLDEKGVSFGCAFGDLDGDGDLDVVYSNYDKGLTVLRNDSQEGHRLIIDLVGVRANRFGIGAKITLSAGGQIQTRTLTLARGVLSTSEPAAHFGLGGNDVIDWMTIDWPSGAHQRFERVEADARLSITEPDTSTSPPGRSGDTPSSSATNSIFSEVSGSKGLDFIQAEPVIDEQSAEPLLPMRQNWRGPAVAAGNLDDGRYFIVFGGTSRSPRSLRIQNGAVYIEANTQLVGPAMAPDDGPILIFDANGDGHEDILISKGGAAAAAGSTEYQPSLWLGDGNGNFAAAPADALPSWTESVGALAAGDFDGNGSLDVFVGTRVVPGQYGTEPQSGLWRNIDGRFQDVTEEVCPALRTVGRVTGCAWVDIDGDHWPDLIVTTEWGFVRSFRNENGKTFHETTEESGFGSGRNGLWSSIAVADFNNDGIPDIAVGNLGLNTPYQPPIAMWCGDFRGNGATQIIEARFSDGRWVPLRSRKEMTAAIPSIARKYAKTDAYARASVEEIFGKAKLAAAARFEADELQSGIFLSDAKRSYHFSPLPRLAQISPAEGIAALDIDADGPADLLIIQNNFAPFAYMSRFDGGLGQWLKGRGDGQFTCLSPGESGFIVPGDGRGIAVIDLGSDGQPGFIITRNRDRSLAFQSTRPSQRFVGRHVALLQPGPNASAVGARVTAVHSKGSAVHSWIQATTGNYSQSSKEAWFADSPSDLIEEIIVTWPDGVIAKYTRGDANAARWLIKR